MTARPMTAPLMTASPVTASPVTVRARSPRVTRVAFVLVVLAGMFGCAATSRMRTDLTRMKGEVERVRADAYRCAPRELARADTAIEFTGGELDQGDMARAKSHYRDAQEFFKKTMDIATAESCRPKPLPPKPPEPPKPVIADRDGDGIPDAIDRCPDDPGPREWQGCPDSDGDGIPNHEDKCPSVPGPKENQGCPWGDRDGDGVKDNVDRCPDLPGPRENDGCPWGDKDGDGVPDNLDRCPQEPGPKENQGCPWPDRDKDGVPDKDDKCPDVPGLPELQGCPRPELKFVEVTKQQIRIKQKIHFKFGKATIRERSYPILDEVAMVLRTYPKMKVRIEGHTDSRGSKKFNLKLSHKRANSVREYLVEKGIGPHRLSAKGFGMKTPIESNKTKGGRAANRRVEFHIAPEEASTAPKRGKRRLILTADDD